MSKPKLKRKSFDPQFDDKRNLVRWVREQFPKLKAYAFCHLSSYKEFEERLPEIHRAAMQVLNRLMRDYPSPLDSMHRYYHQDYIKLPRALKAKNLKEYALCLDDFLDGISLE